MLNLSGNDYLGLAAEEKKPYEGELYGSASSRLLTGNYEIYDRLENAMAKTFGREAALVFNSGYHMNTGILPALADDHTLVIADKLVHASMIDGIRLSRCKFERFRHNDLNHLKKILQKSAGDYESVIVMAESIYSMDGDIADLRGLVALKKQFPQVMLYIDEAHGIGVRGQNGLGLAEETGTIQDIDFLLGTFGKALGSMGGYIICDAVIKEYLVNKCRSLIFSTALPPLTMSFNMHIFTTLPTLGEKRRMLDEYATLLRKSIEDLGYPMPSESHIVPLLIGDNHKTIQVAEQLQKLGYYVLPIRPPTVPAGTSRLRFSLTSATPVASLIKDLQEILVHYAI